MDSIKIILLIFVCIFIGIYIFFKGLNFFSLNFRLFDLDNFFYKLNGWPKLLLIFIGIICSGFIQSTAICITLLIPLVHENKINIKNSFYLIIGFNIGTVISLFISGIGFLGWIILLLCSNIILKIAESKTSKAYISILKNTVKGILLIFLGLFILKISFYILTKTFFFNNLINYLLSNYMLSFLTGIILSAIIQSGSIICNTFQQIYISTNVSIDGILLIIIGSNIGSSLIGILASLKFDLKSKMISYFHVGLNLIGSIIILTFFNQFKNILFTLTINKQYQLSISHLLLNTLSGLVLIPFVNFLVNRINKYI